ncbi:eukaryotic aspartyl protease family protein [Actinidia rufa]|uniref:Eukaryotic aspartyl protease family protein n=1 Tax=Actinidia rufa TaxID=165716 RepID=A0A7J0FU96_9ERIC|nr:eukaryotic aspartyl protease family protein [Actinidia rufa]
MLILPLKTQLIPSGSLPRLPFHHNVTLTVSLSPSGRPHRTLQWSSTQAASSPGSTATRPRSKNPHSTRPDPNPTSPSSAPRPPARPGPGTSPYPPPATRTTSATPCYRTPTRRRPKAISATRTRDSKTTGLMGMNRGSLSFVSQMGFPKFSYCISGYDLPGLLLLGDTNFTWLAPLNYTPLIQISTPLPYFDRVAYTVQLEGIRVSDKLLPLPKSVFVPDHTGAGQTMVDSGAMDLCYLIPPGQPGFLKLPTVSLVFRGAEMLVSGDGLLYRVSGELRGNDSVYCFTFGNSDLLGIEAYVIGHHHQQNVWMEFDLQNSRIGLAQVRCDLAGQRFDWGRHDTVVLAGSRPFNQLTADCGESLIGR